MRRGSREDRRANVATWLGVAGLAATAIRLIVDVVRRHDAKLLAEHEQARKIAKQTRKKAGKARKKLAKKARPPLAAVHGARR